jgi:hypothetical protein
LPTRSKGFRAPIAQMSNQVIRVHPRRIISWGVVPASPSMSARDVPGTTNEAA